MKFVVRGDMSLTKLRNKIFCASDFWSNLEDFESGYNKDAFFSVEFLKNVKNKILFLEPFPVRFYFHPRHVLH